MQRNSGSVFSPTFQSLSAGRVRLPAETNDGERQEENARFDPGTVEEEVSTEEERHRLFTHPPLPRHPFHTLLLSEALTPSDNVPPAVDHLTPVMSLCSRSIGVMSQVRPRCTPESDRALKLSQSLQETGSWLVGEAVEEVAPLWSLRTLQSVKEVLGNRT